MSVISHLLILYVGILVINVGLSGLLWARRGGELHKRLFFVWATSCASFVTQGAATRGALQIVYGFSVVYFVNLALAYLVAGVASTSIVHRNFTRAYVAALALAALIFWRGGPFWLIALPVSIAVAAPLIATAGRVWVSHRQKLSLTSKALVVSCCLFSVHNLDFPFLRMREGLAELGFTVALFVVVTLSITAPGAALERITEDRVRIEHLDRLKTQFFSNVTHELRTPLTMIMAPLESLLDGEVGHLKPQQKEYLRPIQRNAMKLLRLINDLLDLAKLEENYLHLHVERTDLVNLLQEIVEEARPFAARKDISLVLQIRSATDQLLVDLEKMERVFVNLLSNALKFTEAGGSVMIWLEAHATEAQIGVCDTGIGIASDKLKAIFERFNQGDNSITRRYGGTGIGLALARETVELHGGIITVSSTEGKGSQFVVHLPKRSSQFEQKLFDTQQSQAPASSRSQIGLGAREWTRMLVERKEYRYLEIAEATERRIAERGDGKRKPNKVLVVEDDPDVLRFIHMHLNDSHDVYLAPNGAKGLELAVRELPDVIVTDYMMPEMDGITLIRKLRAEGRTQNIPVIMLTARNHVQDRVDAREAGAETFLSKPFSPKELRTAVHQMLAQRGRQISYTLHEQVKSLEHISAGLAHEIHNPLNYIRSSLFVATEFFEKLKHAAANADPTDPLASIVKEARDNIDRMHQIAQTGVDRIARVVELVRHYAREGYDREPTAVPVDTLIAEMAPLFALPSTNVVEVKLDLATGGACVRCVPEELQQSIGNLWQNALDALGPGGCVWIRTRTTEESISIEVEDNGSGIPREHLGQIFVPFFTTKGPGKSLGLGLSIAYQVVSQAGGTICVTSTERQGTTFRITLPKCTELAPATACA